MRAPCQLLPLSALLLCALCLRPAAGAPGRALRVCADPNNLPFSNARREGLEDRIAQLLARDLGAELRYTYWAQRRGFFRSTLKAGACDVVLGVPAGLEMVLPTRPYYRSSYVFAWRKDRGLRIRSLDDPALRRLRIGVPVVGDDGAGAPPAHALARRGIVDNVVGYSVYGDYAKDSPPAAIMEALVRGEIDVAVVWGPLAGYAARRGAPIELAPIEPQRDGALPFTFSIAMGVRRGDRALRDELDALLARRRAEIGAILKEYGVPLL